MILVLVPAAQAFSATIVDLEGFRDSIPLINQSAGFEVVNATILTAGISLNEFEFPLRSGPDVASDDGGPLSLVFDSPQATIGGFLIHS
jgi:hypothetical protein